MFQGVCPLVPHWTHLGAHSTLPPVAFISQFVENAEFFFPGKPPALLFMNIANEKSKRGLQQITINHSSDTEFKDFWL